MENQLLILILIGMTILLVVLSVYNFLQVRELKTFSKSNNDGFHKRTSIIKEEIFELKRTIVERFGKESKNDLSEIFKLHGLSQKYEKAKSLLDYNQHGIYVNYHKLTAIWVSNFLCAYSNLHTIITLVSQDKYEQAEILALEYIDKRHYKYPYYHFLEHKEYFPKLIIEQVNTGNSIIFKTKDGWLPEIDSKNGDFIITLPKKVAPMVYTGILISTLTTVGITNYKNLHQGIYAKNQNEKIELENSKLQSEVEHLQSKIRKNEMIEDYISYQLKTMQDTLNHPDISKVTFVQKDNLRIESN